jgi:hypothetical protein
MSNEPIPSTIWFEQSQLDASPISKLNLSTTKIIYSCPKAHNLKPPPAVITSKFTGKMMTAQTWREIYITSIGWFETRIASFSRTTALHRIGLVSETETVGLRWWILHPKGGHIWSSNWCGVDAEIWDKTSPGDLLSFPAKKKSEIFKNNGRRRASISNFHLLTMSNPHPWLQIISWTRASSAFMEINNKKSLTRYSAMTQVSGRLPLVHRKENWGLDMALI